ncbi:MAG: hypothetical protein WBD17_08230, partial [Candidatus Omnitrophota bacterium]
MKKDVSFFTGSYLPKKSIRDLFIKIFSTITAIAFFINILSYDIVLSGPFLQRTKAKEGQAWAIKVSPELPHVGFEGDFGPGSHKKFNIENFVLPEYLGTVTHRCDASFLEKEPEKFVVVIQDAHCNYDAQRKIAEIVQYLNIRYGMGVINLEGGKEGYDLSLFTDIQNRSIRDEVSDYFVAQGLVNGAEYYAINNAEKVRLWGIENAELYMDNLKSYRDSLAYKEEVDEYLKTLTHALSNLKLHIYSEDLLGLDILYSQYKAGNMGFKDYLTRLIKMAHLKKIDIKTFKDIELLETIFMVEEVIDFKQADIEKDELIRRLQEVLSGKEIQELAGKMVEFESERISRAEFYRYLAEKADKVNILMVDYTQLGVYIDYVSMYQEVDRIEAIKEMERLEARIQESLFKDEKQKELALLSKNLALTKNIFNASITKADYEYYIGNKTAFEIQNYISFVQKEAPLYKIGGDLPEDIKIMDLYREEMETFYDLSFKRDLAFLDNIKFSKIQDPTSNIEQQVSILITGGFHTEHLCDLFKKEGIAYVSIMPNFKIEEDYKCPYFDLLAGKKCRVERSISELMGYSLAIASLLSGLKGAHGKRAEELFYLHAQWKKAVAEGKDGLIIRVAGVDVGAVDKEGNIVKTIYRKDRIKFAGAIIGEGLAPAGRPEPVVITDNIARGITAEEENAWRERIAEPEYQRTIRRRNRGWLNEVRRRSDALLALLKEPRNVRRMREALSKKMPASEVDKQIMLVIEALRNPTDSFLFFESLVWGPETYILGHHVGLAVDVIGHLYRRERQLMRSEGLSLNPNLVGEYILHEALERTGLSHEEIIALTTTIFARGKYGVDFTRPGETPLGEGLRGFLDERVAAREARAGPRAVYARAGWITALLAAAAMLLAVVWFSWSKPAFVGPGEVEPVTPPGIEQPELVKPAVPAMPGVPERPIVRMQEVEVDGKPMQITLPSEVGNRKVLSHEIFPAWTGGFHVSFILEKTPEDIENLNKARDVSLDRIGAKIRALEEIPEQERTPETETGRMLEVLKKVQADLKARDMKDVRIFVAVSLEGEKLNAHIISGVITVPVDQLERTEVLAYSLGHESSHQFVPEVYEIDDPQVEEDKVIEVGVEVFGPMIQVSIARSPEGGYGINVTSIDINLKMDDSRAVEAVRNAFIMAWNQLEGQKARGEEIDPEYEDFVRAMLEREGLELKYEAAPGVTFLIDDAGMRVLSERTPLMVTQAFPVALAREMLVAELPETRPVVLQSLLANIASGRGMFSWFLSPLLWLLTIGSTPIHEWAHIQAIRRYGISPELLSPAQRRGEDVGTFSLIWSLIKGEVIVHKALSGVDEAHMEVHVAGVRANLRASFYFGILLGGAIAAYLSLSPLAFWPMVFLSYLTAINFISVVVEYFGRGDLAMILRESKSSVFELITRRPHLEESMLERYFYGEKRRLSRLAKRMGVNIKGFEDDIEKIRYEVAKTQVSYVIKWRAIDQSLLGDYTTPLWIAGKKDEIWQKRFNEIVSYLPRGAPIFNEIKDDQVKAKIIAEVIGEIEEAVGAARLSEREGYFHSVIGMADRSGYSEIMHARWGKEINDLYLKVKKDVAEKRRERGDLSSGYAKGMLIKEVFDSIRRNVKGDLRQAENYVKYHYVLDINQVLSDKKGVCRHMGIITAMMLEKLIQQKELDGLAFYVRRDFHAWAMYATTYGELIVLDAAQSIDGVVEQFGYLEDFARAQDPWAVLKSPASSNRERRAWARWYAKYGRDSEDLMRNPTAVRMIVERVQRQAARERAAEAEGRRDYYYGTVLTSGMGPDQLGRKDMFYMPAAVLQEIIRQGPIEEAAPQRVEPEDLVRELEPVARDVAERFRREGISPQMWNMYRRELMAKGRRRSAVFRRIHKIILDFHTSILIKEQYSRPVRHAYVRDSEALNIAIDRELATAREMLAAAPPTVVPGKGVLWFISGAIFGLMNLLGITITPARKDFVEDFIIPLLEEGGMLLVLCYWGALPYLLVRLGFAIMHARRSLIKAILGRVFLGRAPPVGEKPISQQVIEQLTIPAIASAAALLPLIALAFGVPLSPAIFGFVAGTGLFAHILGNRYVTEFKSRLQKAVLGEELGIDYEGRPAALEKVKTDYETLIRPLTNIPFDELPGATKEILFGAGVDNGLVEMSRSAGRNARDLFRSGFPVLKDAILVEGDPDRTRENLMAIASGLVRIGAASESFGHADYVFRLGLPKLIQAFGPELIREQWETFVLFGETAGKNARYLFGATLPAFRETIIVEGDVQRTRQNLLDIGNSILRVVPENDEIAEELLNNALPAVSGIIIVEGDAEKAKDNLNRIGSSVLRVLEAAGDKVRGLFRHDYPRIEAGLGAEFVKTHWEGIFRLGEAAGTAAGNFFKNGFAGFIQSFGLDFLENNWQDIVKLGEIAGKRSGYDVGNIFNRTLVGFAKIYGLEFVKDNWRDLMDIAGSTGKDAAFLLSNGFYSLEEGFGADFIKAHWKDLVEYIKTNGEYALELVKDGLPSMKEAIVVAGDEAETRQNLRAVGEALASVARAAGKQEATYVFSQHLPDIKRRFGKEFIRDCWKDMLGLGASTGKNVRYFFRYALSEFSKTIVVKEDVEKTRENLRAIGNELVKLSNAAGEHALVVFEYGIPAMIGAIAVEGNAEETAKNLDIIGSELIALALLDGEDAGRLFEYGLPALEKVLIVEQDAEKTKENLASAGKELFELAAKVTGEMRIFWRSILWSQDDIVAEGDFAQTIENLKTVGKDRVEFTNNAGMGGIAEDFFKTVFNLRSRFGLDFLPWRDVIKFGRIHFIYNLSNKVGWEFVRSYWGDLIEIGAVLGYKTGEMFNEVLPAVKSLVTPESIQDLVRWVSLGDPVDTDILKEFLALSREERADYFNTREDELARIRDGKFDIADQKHLFIGYRLILDDIRDNPTVKKDITYKEYLSYVKAGKPAKERFREKDRAELTYLCYEALKLMNFIRELKARADSLGRPLVLVENITYGWMATIPIEEEIKAMGVKIIKTKAGSTFAHDNPTVMHGLNPHGPDDSKLFSEEDLRYFVEEQPLVLVVDGTYSLDPQKMARFRRKGARYPDAHQAYRNYFHAISGEPKDNDFDIDRLRLGSKLKEDNVYKAVRRSAEDIKPAPERGNYQMRFWYPGKKSLGLNSQRKSRKLSSQLDLINSKNTDEPLLDKISGPTLIFSVANMEDEAIPDSVRQGGIYHNSAHFDDKEPFGRTFIDVTPYGPKISNEFQNAAIAEYKRLSQQLGVVPPLAPPAVMARESRWAQYAAPMAGGVLGFLTVFLFGSALLPGILSVLLLSAYFPLARQTALAREVAGETGVAARPVDTFGDILGNFGPIIGPLVWLHEFVHRLTGVLGVKRLGIFSRFMDEAMAYSVESVFAMPVVAVSSIVYGLVMLFMPPRGEEARAPPAEPGIDFEGEWLTVPMIAERLEEEPQLTIAIWEMLTPEL